jgi:integrase
MSKSESSIVWLKPEQVEAMRDAAYHGRNGARDEAIVALVYDTGLRRAEAAAVEREMLDLDAGELRIPPAIQKQPSKGEASPVAFELDRSGDLRTVRTLRSYLSSSSSSDPTLFGVGGRTIYNAVQRTAERADVRPYTYSGRADATDVSAHTLRHSVAYRMLRAEEGNTFYDVRNRLRHSSIKTTEEYYDHFDTV